MAGRPIRVELRRSLGPHLAATSIPRRLILLDSQVLRKRGDFERILIHEIFHFAWVRLSNQHRRTWEMTLESELDSRARGELGWSAEWRKTKLDPSDRTRRSPAWRSYACESFCDSGAWMFAGLGDHDEFTLAERFRRRRAAWFERTVRATGTIRI
jgi:hypothetical protein